jgi:hypothetical protein
MTMNKKTILTLVTLGLISAARAFAADTILIESRTAADTTNAPAWKEISGAWGKSKNKAKLDDGTAFTAKNATICATNNPKPVFRIAPEGLETGKSYKVEVAFGTSKSQHASADLIVGVYVTGVSACTIPTNTPVFQEPNANAWNTLGTITPKTNHPALYFRYVSGMLSPTSRWYADAIRFVPEGAAESKDAAEPKDKDKPAGKSK